MKDIDVMDGIEFERYTGKILKNNGYTNIRYTEKYDYGVDIIATKDGARWGMQARRYSGLAKADAVRQVVAGLSYYGCDRAMVTTNSHFRKVAERLAKCNACRLMAREELAKIAS